MQSSIGALADVALPSYVQHVETLMLFGSVLLTRFQVLPESWLHNDHPIIAFSSLDCPYICLVYANPLTVCKVTGVSSFPSSIVLSPPLSLPFFVPSVGLLSSSLLRHWSFSALTSERHMLLFSYLILLLCSRRPVTSAGSWSYLIEVIRLTSGG